MVKALQGDVEQASLTLLTQKLRQLLPRAAESSVLLLVHTLLEPDKPLSSNFVKKLLLEHATPHEIQLAMIYGRDLLLMQTKPWLTAEKQGEHIREFLLHYDRIMALLLKEQEIFYEQDREKLQAQLIKEGQEHLLSNARNRWMRERDVSIYNHYKELPISTQARILEISKTGFTVKKSGHLIPVLSAGEDARFAYIRLPEGDLSVRVSVEEVTRKTVHWHYAGMIRADREKRRDIRVQCDASIPVTLTSVDQHGRQGAFKQDQGAWEGVVYDLSASGLGIALKHEVRLQVGDQLRCSLLLHTHELKADAEVRWVERDQHHYHLGIALEYESENHLRLENEVKRRQRDIMGELKLKGLPDCLTSI